MKLIAAAVLIVALIQVAGTHFVNASVKGPPPPPPTPKCLPCKGPPPPPTRVPTAPVGVVPVVTPVVALHLVPNRVHRGHPMKLSVSASEGLVVVAKITYRQGKPVVYKGRVKDSGSFSKSWKVPKKAALGKGKVTVTVPASASGEKSSIGFLVLK